MSFDRLALALAYVEINEISEIELVRLIRASVNEGQSDMNKVTLSTGIVIARALKLVESQGYWKARDFVAGGS